MTVAFCSSPDFPSASGTRSGFFFLPPEDRPSELFVCDGGGIAVEVGRLEIHADGGKLALLRRVWSLTQESSGCSFWGHWSERCKTVAAGGFCSRISLTGMDAYEPSPTVNRISAEFGLKEFDWHGVGLLFSGDLSGAL